MLAPPRYHGLAPLATHKHPVGAEAKEERKSKTKQSFLRTAGPDRPWHTCHKGDNPLLRPLTPGPSPARGEGRTASPHRTWWHGGGFARNFLTGHVVWGYNSPGGAGG